MIWELWNLTEMDPFASRNHGPEVIQAVTFSSPSWRSLYLLKGSLFHHPKKVTSRMAKATEFSWVSLFLRDTLQGTNISPWEGIFEDDFPFPRVGYVSFLEGIFLLGKKITSDFFKGELLDALLIRTCFRLQHKRVSLFRIGDFLISTSPLKKWLLENSGWSPGWLPGHQKVCKLTVFQWWICYKSKKDTKWKVKWTESFATLVLSYFCFPMFFYFYYF